MSTAISLCNVNFAYNGAQNILENVNLDISPGEFIGIIGPNGGGKTTLLKVIIGLLQPTTGTVKVFGKPPQLARKLIGYVPQFGTFNRDFPIIVEDVVLMGRLGNSKSFSYSRRAERKIVSTILEQLGIVSLQKRPINTLSGGQLQRVMVARALVHEPKLLLLDEPTANVDMHAEQNIFDLFKSINSKVTILVVSHDIGFVSRYIKRVVCVNKTLLCHHTATLTAELIQQVYGINVRKVQHGSE